MLQDFDSKGRDPYHAAVMSDVRLPDRIDPLRVAEGRRRHQGVIALATMPRLVSYLTDDAGEARVEILGGVDEEGFRYLRGRIDAEVQIRCQRCLEGFPLVLEAEFALGVVMNEQQAERLPERYEPLMVSEEPIFLRDIVEDELILSLPIVPKHPDGQCPSWSGGDDKGQDEGGRENPFAALKKLNTKKD